MAAAHLVGLLQKASSSPVSAFPRGPLASVERVEERADGPREVVLRIARQVRDEGAAPPRVHQLDRDEAVHCRPDEVRVGRRVRELGFPAGDSGGEHLEGREPREAAGVGRNEVRGGPLEHEPVERLVVDRESAVGQREAQQVVTATTAGGDAAEAVGQPLEAVEVELLEQALLGAEVVVDAHRRLPRGRREVANAQRARSALLDEAQRRFEQGLARGCRAGHAGIVFDWTDSYNLVIVAPMNTPSHPPSARTAAGPLLGLTFALLALLILNLAVFDDLRVDASAGVLETFAKPQHLSSLLAVLLAVGMVAFGHRSAARVAVVVAWIEIAAFTFFHAIPLQIGPTKPYWGDGMGDTLQWVGLLSILACSVAIVTVARRSAKGSPTSAGASVTA